MTIAMTEATELFARRLAGAYLVDRGPAGRGLLNIMADGNIFSEETNDFGDGVPNAFQSGSRGSWKRTGRREIKYTFFVFGYDVNGINTTTVVVLNTASINKSDKSKKSKKSKKRSFDRWNVTGGFEVFTADQDPLDPNEVPFFAAEVPPFSARRIPVGR